MSVICNIYIYIWVLTEGLCLEVNLEVQLRIDSSRPSIW